MMYIHEHTEWPRFVWDVAALAGMLATVRHKQGRLAGRMEGVSITLRHEASLETLTSDVVKSSAIEGERLDPERVRSSIASRMGLGPRGRSKADRHVEGIVEVMMDAKGRFDEPLTQARLFKWHAALFPMARSGMHAITVGAWRRDEHGPMRVVSGHEQRRVHFEAPAAARLAREMKRFLAWFEGPRHSEDGVLRAGIAHLWFVTIHPFDDGNGRIARAIADMTLARAEGTGERYSSMSAQIEKEKREYYQELERQQRGDVDITGWLAWFLGCLGRSIDAAEDTLTGVVRKSRYWERANRAALNERQRRVIERMLGPFEGKMTTSKYAKLAKCSTDTALRDIQGLVEAGLLVRNAGGGRSTSYGVGTE